MKSKLYSISFNAAKSFNHGILVVPCRFGTSFVSPIVNENLDSPGFTDAGPGLIKTLRRFREQPGSLQEKCEFCGVGLETEHRHLLEVSKNRIACTCSPFALAFQV